MKKIRSYIFFFYFKYLLSFFLIGMTLIWFSQILRILDLKFSISNQLDSIIITTFLVLPNYSNPLLPIIMLITLTSLNYSINNNNEILIFNQYLSENNKKLINIITQLLLILIFFINNEIISPKLYELYKKKELEIRNNFKLGTSKENELHINEELSIFFEGRKKNHFQNVDALIYKDNLFIKSKTADIEFGINSANIIFYDGERIEINTKNQNKTVFKKFSYGINKTNIDNLLYDKDHYNTLELLKSDKKDFINYGHYKIFNYLLVLIIALYAHKIIFINNYYKKSKSKNLFLYLFLLIIYTINSFLIYKLNQESFKPFQYYIINILILLIFVKYLNYRYNDN